MMRCLRSTSSAPEGGLPEGEERKPSKGRESARLLDRRTSLLTQEEKNELLSNSLLRRRRRRPRLCETSLSFGGESLGPEQRKKFLEDETRSEPKRKERKERLRCLLTRWSSCLLTSTTSRPPLLLLNLLALV